jgi:NitT/TauT family transport system substrate-binding protein
VRDWPDLRGRVTAVPPGRPTVGDYLLARSLERGGLGFGDVDVIELPLPDYLPAFASGRLDLGHVPEPLATAAVDRGFGVKWRATGDYLGVTTLAVMTYGPSLLEGPADVGQRFMAAYLRGARDYNAAFRRGVGRGEAVQALVKHTSVKDAPLYDRIGLGALDPDGALNMASLADQAAFYVGYGSIPTPVDVATLVDHRFREAAVARLGPAPAQ